MKSYYADYRDFPLNAVHLSDPYCQNALKKERDYLLSLEPDRLLAGFREVKGLFERAERYSGWESSEIQGHTLGHYCTALSQLYETTGDKLILERIRYIVNELELCQGDNGFLFASPETFFDKVEQQRPVWVPWYTMHKIISGLISIQIITPVDTLSILTRLGDWVFERTSVWDEKTHRNVLKVEYGGMNDCLYDLYRITGKEEHARAAHCFDETELFDEVRQGRDILCDLHANTTIPKFLGAVKRYLVMGETELPYLEAAESFWDMVVFHHSYITGGNSEWEHFGQPDILDAERSQYTCETCNSYNMLKLSKALFMVTGKKKFLDFYEKTFLNAILPTQNPDTGMTMYFQPMAAGFFKVYSRPYDKFWCCTGTGMENFTKLNDGIFYERDSELTIARYVSCRINWDINNVSLLLEENLLNRGKVECQVLFADEGISGRFTLRFRLPEWCGDDSRVCVNGETIPISKKDKEEGFLSLQCNWQDGDCISLYFPPVLSYERLPDNPNAVAFKYGPYVLCAGTGNEKQETSKTGVDVDIPVKREEIKDYINLPAEIVQEWLETLSDHLVKSKDGAEFLLKREEENDTLHFVPYYRCHHQRYGIYWYLFGTDSDKQRQDILRKEEERRLLENATLDRIPVGNDQYELEHQAKGEETWADTYNGYKFREARQGGWFSYSMKIDPEVDNLLRLELVKIHLESLGEIYIDDKRVSTLRIPGIHPPEFAVEEIPIPRELTNGKKSVIVKFLNKHEAHGFRIAGLLRTTRNL